MVGKRGQVKGGEKRGVLMGGEKGELRVGKR